MKYLYSIAAALLLAVPTQALSDNGPCNPGNAIFCGLQGEPGPQGVPGQNGSDGKNGAPGADGVNGSDGAQGPAGANGSDGANGKVGAQGADGAPGVGLRGERGQNGAVDPRVLAAFERQIEEQDQRLDNLEQEQRAGVAAGVAAGSHQYDLGYDGLQGSLAGGNYRGENAVSIGLGIQADDRTFLNGSITHTSTGRAAFGIGISRKF